MLISILSGILTVAAAVQSPYDAKAFDLPTETEASLREGVTPYLRDAETARFRAFRDARSGVFAGGVDTTPREGRIYCVQINAKNGYGAYVGFRDYVVVLTDSGQAFLTERMDRHLKNPFLVDAECARPADPAA